MEKGGKLYFFLPSKFINSADEKEIAAQSKYCKKSKKKSHKNIFKEIYKRISNSNKIIYVCAEKKVKY